MALEKAAYKVAIEAAFNGIWAAGDLATLSSEIEAAFTAGFSDQDPTNAAVARTTAANAIAAAVHKYVHGANFDKVTALATALSNAGDTFVKTGVVSTTVIGTLPNGPVAATGSGGIT